MPPAARLTDVTTHGTPLAPGPGSATCMIGFMPAWRANIDQHACPMVNVTGPDGVGAVVMGSPTVMIDYQMAARMGDIVIEKPGLALGPANPIILGCPTVMIGEMGGGPSAASAGAIAAAVEAAAAASGSSMTDSTSAQASAYSLSAAATQHEALVNASKNGTPFCEECEKAREAALHS